MVERPGTLRARHRRGLHRAGFRPQRLPGGPVWLWTPPAGLLPALPDRAEGFGAFVKASLGWAGVRDRLLVEQALHVVRDVFAAGLEDVTVLPPEPPWEDEADEPWPEHG